MRAGHYVHSKLYIPVAPHFFSRSDVLIVIWWGTSLLGKFVRPTPQDILPSKPFTHLRHLRQFPDVSITSHSQCPSVLPPTNPQSTHSLSLKPRINTNNNNTTTTKNNLTNTPILSRPHHTSTPTPNKPLRTTKSNPPPCPPPAQAASPPSPRSRRTSKSARPSPARLTPENRRQDPRTRARTPKKMCWRVTP